MKYPPWIDDFGRIIKPAYALGAPRSVLAGAVLDFDEDNLKQSDGSATDIGEVPDDWPSSGLNQSNADKVSLTGTKEADGLNFTGTGRMQVLAFSPTITGLEGGAAMFLVGKVPDISDLGATNQIAPRDSGNIGVLDLRFPVSSTVVQLAAGGSSLQATGISQSDMETEAVWAFVVDVAGSRLRISRNGTELAASTPSLSALADATNMLIGFNAKHTLRRLMLFSGQVSTEEEAKITAALMSEYGIS